jgi:sugar lactone lactonase YvrE
MNPLVARSLATGVVCWGIWLSLSCHGQILNASNAERKPAWPLGKVNDKNESTGIRASDGLATSKPPDEKVSAKASGGPSEIPASRTAPADGLRLTLGVRPTTNGPPKSSDKEGAGASGAGGRFGTVADAVLELGPPGVLASTGFGCAAAGMDGDADGDAELQPIAEYGYAETRDFLANLEEFQLSQTVGGKDGDAGSRFVMTIDGLLTFAPIGAPLAGDDATPVLPGAGFVGSSGLVVAVNTGGEAGAGVSGGTGVATRTLAALAAGPVGHFSLPPLFAREPVYALPTVSFPRKTSGSLRATAAASVIAAGRGDTGAALAGGVLQVLQASGNSLTAGVVSILRESTAAPGFPGGIGANVSTGTLSLVNDAGNVGSATTFVAASAALPAGGSGTPSFSGDAGASLSTSSGATFSGGVSGFAGVNVDATMVLSGASSTAFTVTTAVGPSTVVVNASVAAPAGTIIRGDLTTGSGISLRKAQVVPAVSGGASSSNFSSALVSAGGSGTSSSTLTPAISGGSQVLIVSLGSQNTLDSIPSANSVNTFSSSRNLRDPQGLAFSLSGNLYAANFSNNTIEQFSVSANGLTGTDSGTFATTGLSGPTGLAFDSSGNLYVANQTGNTIEKFASNGTGTTFVPATGGLSAPTGLAFDSLGNLYVTNSSANTVDRITPGGTVTTILPASSGLSSPVALAFDAAGNLYVSNATTSQILEFAYNPAQGTFSTTATVFVNESFLSGPAGLAFDSSGDLYVANSFTGQILEYSPTGSSLGTFATGLNDPGFLAFATVIPEPHALGLLLISVGVLGLARQRRLGEV